MVANAAPAQIHPPHLPSRADRQLAGQAPVKVVDGTARVAWPPRVGMWVVTWQLSILRPKRAVKSHVNIPVVLELLEKVLSPRLVPTTNQRYSNRARTDVG